jgi:hypothetical protein
MSSRQHAVAAASRLDREGYVIPKSVLLPAELSEIRSALTVSPLANPQFAFGPPATWSLLRETATHVYLPRYFGKAIPFSTLETNNPKRKKI